ncbi:MAG: hypothetical protein ACXWYM_00200 [Candidatus Binatia bacterium]
MKNVSDELQARISESWKKSNDALRGQTLAREVFGQNIDPHYGMIVEKKESGGVKLTPIDPKYTRPSTVDVKAAMADRGWRTSVIALPRSGRVTVCMENEALGITVGTHPMPEEDGVRMCAILAVAAEKEVGLA